MADIRGQKGALHNFLTALCPGMAQCERALKECYGSYPFDFWCYRQLADFVTLQHYRAPLRTTLMEFESLWAEQDPQPHMISAVYKLLETAKPSPKPFYIEEWECNLQCEFTNEQLNHLYCLTHSS